MTYWRSFDITVLSSVVVWEIPLPEVGIVLSFGVQLVSPWIEPAFRENPKMAKSKVKLNESDKGVTTFKKLICNFINTTVAKLHAHLVCWFVF